LDLRPIFEEVYQYAKEVNPSLNNGIKIYIMDVMYVNAFAIGRQTIAVTRGALNTFNTEELKGIIAHELGHMTYGHTKALLLTHIGNIFFSIIVFVLRILLYICEFISSITARMNVVGLVFWLIAFITSIIFEISVFIFVNLGDLILSLNSRKNELQADKFAYDIGMGHQMISALYLLQKISINQKLKISEKLKASHPYIADRIGQLERLEELAYS
jgi:heat shock protein HtpX